MIFFRYWFNLHMKSISNFGKSMYVYISLIYVIVCIMASIWRKMIITSICCRFLSFVDRYARSSHHCRCIQSCSIYCQSYFIWPTAWFDADIIDEPLMVWLITCAPPCSRTSSSCALEREETLYSLRWLLHYHQYFPLIRYICLIFDEIFLDIVDDII